MEDVNRRVLRVRKREMVIQHTVHRYKHNTFSDRRLQPALLLQSLQVRQAHGGSSVIASSLTRSHQHGFKGHRPPRGGPGARPALAAVDGAEKGGRGWLAGGCRECWLLAAPCMADGCHRLAARSTTPRCRGGGLRSDAGWSSGCEQRARGWGRCRCDLSLAPSMGLADWGRPRQQRYRTPWMDTYFFWTAIFGSGHPLVIALTRPGELTERAATSPHLLHDGSAHVLFLWRPRQGTGVRA